MNANLNGNQSNPFLARLKTVHPDGSTAVAPFVALTERELRLCDDVGIMYAVVKGDQIVEIYKKPPVRRDYVERDEAVKNAGTKGYGKSAKVEYDRLIRHSKIMQFYREQAWHKHLIEHGCELWRGKITSRHLCEPEKIEFVEVTSVHLQDGQIDALTHIADYLTTLHECLKSEYCPTDRKNFWDEGKKNFTTISTLGMAAKYLSDFIKYTEQQEDNSELPVNEWFDPDGGWEI